MCRECIVLNYQGFLKGEELCLSCDFVRSTVSMTYGWLYLYKELKWQDQKRNSSPFINPWVLPLKSVSSVLSV